VRIKILEAWARGVPVVATRAALAGLEMEDGREALVAEQPRDFAAAIRRLQAEPGLLASLIAEGRRACRDRHDPQEIASRLMAEYEDVVERMNTR
jgi:glycosyltransferase involved in cell wall biosynthesis